ncbi:hypothetical protein K2P97_05120 [bacterium]|nr:hypothetical protein [bacterium]
MFRLISLLIIVFQFEFAMAISCRALLVDQSLENSLFAKIKRQAVNEYQTDINISSGRAQLNAKENFKHVSRMAEQVVESRSELEKAGVDTKALELAIYFSDIGKSDRASEIIVSLNKNKQGWERNTRMKSFLRHEDYGILLIQNNYLKWGLSAEQAQKIIDGIANHNGPGIADSWFGARYIEEFGQSYDMPYSLEGIVHTFLDRVDQGSLYAVNSASGKILVGGVRKIIFDEVSRNPNKKFSEVVYDIFYNTPAYSEKQVLALEKLSETKTEWAQFFKSDFFREQFSLIQGVAKFRAMVSFPGSEDGAVAVGNIKVLNPVDLFEALENQLNK